MRQTRYVIQQLDEATVDFRKVCAPAHRIPGMTLAGMVPATLAHFPAVLSSWHWPHKLVKLSCASSLKSVAQLLGAVSDVAVPLDIDADEFLGCVVVLLGAAAEQCSNASAHGLSRPRMCLQASTAIHLTAPACLVQLQARLRMQEQFQEDMQGGMQTSIAWDVRQTQASPA